MEFLPARGMFSQQGRRASRACTSCHQRKLRCDASYRGCPCTRCFQNGKGTCILRTKLPRLSVARPEFPKLSPAAMIRLCLSMRHANIRNSSQKFDQNLLTDQSNADERPASDKSPSGSVDFSRYSFLELNGIQELDKDDIAYMDSKGCFSVPDNPMLNEFISPFFLHIHPGVPLLDEAKFWRLYLHVCSP